ncbi:amidase signature domain-containing protein [Podospora australis]|uniref:Amidase signature domain-containing protein n=1 Tax=Podospora australis TaxID=1536484 RepID=A0AAN6WJT2_9PEZI|nr:amidase signature domain-containing protein [Podospora australis]
MHSTDQVRRWSDRSHSWAANHLRGIFTTVTPVARWEHIFYLIIKNTKAGNYSISLDYTTTPLTNMKTCQVSNQWAKPVKPHRDKDVASPGEVSLNIFTPHHPHQLSLTAPSSCDDINRAHQALSGPCLSAFHPSQVSTMAKLPVVEVLPLPQGTREYEALRQSIVDSLADSIPESLRLPESLIKNPPKNVTAIPRECGLLTSEEIDITETYTAVQLAAAIASKQLTSVAVVTAFAKRAAIAHQLTTCLVEFFMDEAIARAKELDDYLEKNGKTVGPLHGVPVSVKEHMPIKGHYSALGFLDTRKLDDKDCQMIATLRAAGAVFYVKTNQPQGIMHLESVAPLGRVLNPHNINLSSGGSTGGEAALLATRGSVLGIGTDIGGSIRGPAGFCGIYGFKATSYTLPQKDFLVGGFAAELNVLCSTGPMCNSLEDMDLFVSILKASKPWLEDPALIPLPWTGLSTPTPKPLKIGIMFHDGHIIPQPPVTRALNWAKSQLKASGNFEVKIFAPFGAKEAMTNIRKAYWPDGGRAVKEHCAKTGEPIFPLTQWVLKDAESDVDVGTEGLLDMRVKRDIFRHQYVEHWNKQDVDVLLCPMFVGPACEHETAFYWNYTAFFNYVDYPGVVFPTPIKAGKKGEEDYAEADKTPLSPEDQHVRDLWAKGDFEGAPIDLQLVARKYHDNDLFGALAQLKDVLQLP